jgi:chromosome segregation protein
LLKLKRVEIQGFKSFYDRTEMKFNGSGIAAIVGPNGCGKSNLSDAISWVLGEQSAKSLRGARMEDVIFAGTRDKKALGMASVTMTLIPDEAAVPGPKVPLSARKHESAREEELGRAQGSTEEEIPPGVETATGYPYVNGQAEHRAIKDPAIKKDAPKTAERTGEMTITRRLYRSGESEYLINGKLARLRDIQDQFLGTGLGPESYAIIEQGRIGQILSNKPQDRRGVIEEAAGITKFKTRKRLAEAKLESAKQNLSRVFDILEEVTRQVNSLKRQAAKTRRYSELKAESTGYLRQVLAAKFRLLERETAKIAIELNLTSAQLATAQSAIGEREAEQATVLEESYANEKELTAARTLLADLHLESERARGRLEYQAKQIEQIEQRLSSGDEEAQALETEQEQRTAELSEQTAELAAMDGKWAESRKELDERSVERQQIQNRVAEQERGLEVTRQRVLGLLGESAALKNRITQMEAQLASADREAERAQGEEQTSESELSRIEELQANLSGRLSERQTELNSVTDRRRRVEDELKEKQAALNESRQALDRLRNEFSRVKARKDSLEEVLRHRSYTTETVKRLFTAVESGYARELRPLGVLADFLEVDPQLEKAAEEFLHEELEYVVVRDWSEAERGIELMRTELDGRATFVVETAHAEGATGELPELASEPGIVAKLTDALQFANGFSNIPLHMLPRIAHCYVVNERAVARDLAAQFAHCWFLTSDGVSYHGRTVSGGKKTGSGPLALKRELREIAGLEQAKQTELESAQVKVRELEEGISTLLANLECLRTEQQAQEKDLLALDHESRKLAEEFERMQSQLSRARLELQRLSRDRIAMQEDLERDREVLNQAEQARSEEERAFEAAREELMRVQAELTRTTEEHATLRANLASLEERRRALGAHQARLEGQIQDLANRRLHLGHEIERLTGERTEFLTGNERLRSTISELSGSISTAQANVNTLADREGELRSRLGSCEEELKRLRAEAQTVQEQRSVLQVALARAESDLAHLGETCEKELDTTLTHLVEDTEMVAETAALEEIEAKYTEVRRKIEALGPVNPQALEEFEEAEQRQEFLNAQRQDLLDSIRDTEKAIQAIDSESRKRFAEAFHAINENFREIFKVLFSGGVGEMRLTDEDNVAESGIDIVASPPGKRLQSVLLLSGGEKSLTAMALLMAIFQYTPSPFCILDEVDAPLDEPNIERLTKLLGELANQTQFIVITHAKRTMEAAEALYGVTMQEPGVSKLVSVKFDGARTTHQNRTVQTSREAQLEAAMV